MKKILLLLCTAIANQFISAQVAINTDGATPNSSAMLDIKSTSKGLLTPRMTTAQRTSITSPATGLMVYDTDVNKFFFYALGSWIEMGTGSATNYWTQNGSHINNNNAGNVGIGTSNPSVALHINRNTDELLRLQGANPYMQLTDGITATGYIQAYGSDLLIGTNFGNSTGAIKFYNNNVVNMLIHPFGNVGIGTGLDYPTHKLTVQTTTSNHGLAHTDGTITVSTYVGSGGGWLGTYSNHPLHFFTNNGNQQMTLLQNGNFGIGTTSPQTKLHIAQDNEALRISGDQSYISFYNGNSWKGYLQSQGTNNIVLSTYGNNDGELYLAKNGGAALTVQSDGRVRVGTLPTVQGLPVTGTLPKFSVHGVFGLRSTFDNQIAEWAIDPYTNLNFFYNGGHKAYVDGSNGDWVSLSDIGLKENFENYKSVLTGIKKLDVLTYHYKTDKTNTRSLGLIAQNVQQYFPEIVSETGGPEKLLGIAYAKTGVLAIKAIQEQQVIIEAQQKKIDELERRLSILENKLR